VRRIKTVFTSSQDKPRRLWRLAVAPQPLIAEHQSAPCPEGTRIYQKPTASSEGAQLWDKHTLTLSWFRKAGPTILLNVIRDASVPPSGNYMGWKCRTYPQLRCFAACSGFHDIGPASRNPQLILNLLASVGAWLQRDVIASQITLPSSTPTHSLSLCRHSRLSGRRRA